MKNGLYTIVEFSADDKWFVMAEKIVDNVKYSYMVQVNATEDDFLDNYQVMKSYFNNDEEYMDVVKGDELKGIMPILIPECKELVDHPDKLRKLLNEL
jgi:predicted secreted protein